MLLSCTRTKFWLWHLSVRPYTLIAVLLRVISAVCTGCGKRHASDQLSSDEEEAIYLLVGQPCSEGDYATAIARADSLFVLPPPIALSDTLRAFIMIDRDVALLESGDFDRGFAYADTVIEFGRQHGVGLAVMQGLQNRGIISRRKGDYERAISDYTEALEIAIAEQDKEMEQTLAEMLAIACGERGRYEEALQFGRQALRLTRENGDSLGEFNTISTIGGILARDGRFESAISELLPYRHRLAEVRPVARIKYLTPLLRAYLGLDSLKRVREVLDETYEALEGVSETSQSYLVAVNTEAELARREGRYADQWKWLVRADSIGAMGTGGEMIYSTRAECLANLGRYAEAYAMECRAFAALDSARTDLNDSRLSELSVRYDTLSKEADIVRLKAQRLLWALVALGCIVVIAVGVICVIAVRRRVMRRQERERQEEYVRGLEQERQRMGRELHDDIAGSLVGLQWQLQAADAPEPAHRVAEIAGRVRRMSHELMPPQFGERTLTQMLLDMVARINTSRRGQRIELTDEGSFDWESLSAEDSHELYRIVQEAVNNALRHGDGNVTVTLDGDTDHFSLSVTNPLRAGAVRPENSDGVGLRSLQARAAILGAELRVSEDKGYFILTITR
ncbi:MAG: tetratricopeptide repeat protein [Muribaculaceae bacterium]|nr:tetratricopeptide repeat protein [Muribaculaceae bacterium]